LSTFFFAKKQTKMNIEAQILENGRQSRFQDRALDALSPRSRFTGRTTRKPCDVTLEIVMRT
jgi:hypothetical protein